MIGVVKSDRTDVHRKQYMYNVEVTSRQKCLKVADFFFNKIRQKTRTHQSRLCFNIPYIDHSR